MYELLMFPPHSLCVNIYVYHWVSNTDNNSSFEWFIDIFSSPHWFCMCLPFTLRIMQFFLPPWDSDTEMQRKCQHLNPIFMFFYNYLKDCCIFPSIFYPPAPLTPCHSHTQQFVLCFPYSIVPVAIATVLLNEVLNVLTDLAISERKKPRYFSSML